MRGQIRLWESVAGWPATTVSDVACGRWSCAKFLTVQYAVRSSRERDGGRFGGGGGRERVYEVRGLLALVTISPVIEYSRVYYTYTVRHTFQIDVNAAKWLTFNCTARAINAVHHPPTVSRVCTRDCKMHSNVRVVQVAAAAVETGVRVARTLCT